MKYVLLTVNCTDIIYYETGSVLPFFRVTQKCHFVAVWKLNLAIAIRLAVTGGRYPDQDALLNQVSLRYS